jgi:hypothetical protein
MKSNKQRRTEILAQRKARVAKVVSARAEVPQGVGIAAATAPCNPDLLAPYNSYGVPVFVARGYYADSRFLCANCQTEEIWRATQQKWWYEVAKGNVESRAKLCHSCRRIERERRAIARKVHLDGLAKKRARNSSA